MKHLVVKSCPKCPFHKLSLHGYFCKLEDRVITEDVFESDHSDTDDVREKGFPEWCPLENYDGK